MSSGRRSCLNNPYSFCYICGEYTFNENRKTLSDFIKKAYLGYLVLNLVIKIKTWHPTRFVKHVPNIYDSGLPEKEKI